MNYKQVEFHWSSKALQYQDDRAGIETDDLNFAFYRTRCEQEILLKLIAGQPRNSALEVGCGNGRLSNWLAHYYKYVSGIDISAEMIRLARQKAPPNVEYYQSRAEDWVGQSAYDFILFSGMFQYLEDEDAIRALENANSSFIISRDTQSKRLSFRHDGDYPVIDLKNT